jgi:hypothetical protein
MFFYNTNRKPISNSTKSISYYDENYNLRSAEIIERNGNLILIKDSETGEEKYVCGFELE